MPDPLSDEAHVVDALRLAAAAAESYLATIDTAPVRPGGNAELSDAPLPREGIGSLEALNELIAASRAAAARSSGPRFFHFVMGGATPAALAADWLTSALDQNAYNWVSSPLAARLEQISLNWLKELFGLPAAWSAVLTTGATMANFVADAIARCRRET